MIALNLISSEELAEMYLKFKKFDEFYTLLGKAEQSEEIEKDFVYDLPGKAAEVQDKYKNAIRFYKRALIARLDNEISDEIRKNLKRTRCKRITSISSL